MDSEPRPPPTAPQVKESKEEEIGPVWVYNAMALREVLNPRTTPSYLQDQRKALLSSVPLSCNTVFFYNPDDGQLWVKMLLVKKRIANAISLENLLWKGTIYGNQEIELGPFFDAILEDFYSEYQKQNKHAPKLSTFRTKRESPDPIENGYNHFDTKKFRGVNNSYFKKTDSCLIL